MGYYIRILGIRNPSIHLDELIDGLKTKDLNAKIRVLEKETPDNWTIINIDNSEGDPLIKIERNPVIPGELGNEEIQEFREEIQDYRPKSAVKWLEKFFKRVKVIYAFQLLDASLDDKNYPIVSCLRETIWDKTGGILQADNEGFSNEKGFHILWQFSDHVTGDWNMAVLNAIGHWINFKMDLGDKEQREEFLIGKVPKHSIRL